MSPNVPDRTSSSSDSWSTSTMPAIAVMSSATPPYAGTLAPQTPLRPATVVTGTRASLQIDRTAATSLASDGLATAAARAGATPSRAQIIARGHQSRLVSTHVVLSVDTSAHADPRRVTRSSGTSTPA